MQPYHSPHAQPTPLEHLKGKLALRLLEAAGHRELPDATLTEDRSLTLKDLARALRANFSSHELFYLAGAVEAEANAKRAEEESRWR